MCKYVSLIIDTLNHDESIAPLLSPANRIHAFIDRKVAEGVLTI